MKQVQQEIIDRQQQVCQHKAIQKRRQDPPDHQAEILDHFKLEYCKDKKKFIRNLCIKYHPDSYVKNDATKKEKLNYYIMEDISKYVNEYYTEFKEKETEESNDSNDNEETTRKEGEEEQ